ncbi:hypothetical protein [Bradyrhizobium sp. RDM4]|uniref:hypothetical protein n=1 Tax=Bradyrhizobium sp. RDM4 TaxID=3378765 RepID=UPI0038FD104B
MTFIIEAIKDDSRTVDFRSSAIVAVILARKLAVNGFVVSITASDGQLFFRRSVQPIADEQGSWFACGGARC